MYIQDCSNKLLQKIVLSDCISTKIRVGIRVRGLHLVPLPHPFPATPLHPRRPQPSAQFSAPISRPQPSAQPSWLIPSGFFSPNISSSSLARTPSAAVRAIVPTHLPSAAVRAAKLAHHQRLLLPTHFQPLPRTHAVRSRPRNSPHSFAVRSRLRSQARSSPAPSSPHSFPATPSHPRRPQPSAQFSPPICRPQPSAQPSSLITSGFFSPPISNTPLHPRRAQPSAQFSAPISRPQPSAQPRRDPPPFPATPLHPRRPQPAQPRSLITSGFFSPSISSHAVALAPSTTVRALLRTHSPSAAVRAAKLAHHQRLLPKSGSLSSTEKPENGTISCCDRSSRAEISHEIRKMLSRPVPSLTYVTYMLSWGLWAQVPDTFLLFSVDSIVELWLVWGAESAQDNSVTL